MTEQYISKKELLKKMNISYGQLYRWKREQLIPEEWFIKKSSPTGQETYFPKLKTEERILFILKMKDKYSLTDLCRIINEGDSMPKVSQRELALSFHISGEIITLMNKQFYNYTEAATLICCNKIFTENIISLSAIKDLLMNIQMPPMTNTGADCIWHLFRIKKTCFGYFSSEDIVNLFDKRVIPVAHFNITKISNSIKNQQYTEGN